MIQRQEQRIAGQFEMNATDLIGRSSPRWGCLLLLLLLLCYYQKVKKANVKANAPIFTVMCSYCQCDDSSWLLLPLHRSSSYSSYTSTLYTLHILHTFAPMYLVIISQDTALSHTPNTDDVSHIITHHSANVLSPLPPLLQWTHCHPSR